MNHPACEERKKQLEHTKHGVGILNAIDCEMTMDLIVMDCTMRGWGTYSYISPAYY